MKSQLKNQRFSSKKENIKRKRHH